MDLLFFYKKFQFVIYFNLNFSNYGSKVYLITYYGLMFKFIKQHIMALKFIWLPLLSYVGLFKVFGPYNFKNSLALKSLR